ncbi:predicted protein [Nematostella vectensis]|uniref:Uncharacterized protein n=1 Tax=Nematostella vectensis TaxID=45351 RepID=A7SF10_NEMVE|nr:predicted protein [Nematostella vectensis]|eukprot:XP_001629733.1 predicted protein [Nematostella vectensis]
MTELAKKYGKIYSLTLPGQQCVVLNSSELAREALLTRKDEFSGRPSTFVGDFITRSSADIICADHTQTMVRLRKIAHKALQMYGRGMQRLEALSTNLRRSKLHFFSDPASLVSKSSRLIKYACKIRDDILTRKYLEHKEKFEIENANNNFEVNDLTDALLQAFADEKRELRKAEALTEDNIMMTMNDVFNAGFETTTTAILWLIAYLSKHPDVQDKIHAELDEVIGGSRMPQLKDRHNMPYIEATIAEILRIRSIVPLALPHKATCDTTLSGYDVPKGTTVIVNLWAIHHDPEEWLNPEEFDPSRFLDADGSYRAAGEKSFLPFSAGRRSCLGEALAKMELFLVCSRILHQFRFSHLEGEAPTLESHAGVVLHPKSFRVVITERA